MTNPVKKILYLYENLNVGGAEQLLLTTLKYLDRNKFFPIVYCIADKGQIGREIEEFGIKVESLNQKMCLWNAATIAALARIFRKEKPDILHCHLFYANYFGRIAAIFSRVPAVIITEHGTYANFKRIHNFFIDSILSCFTAKIIAVSYAVKKYLLRHTFIQKNKIVIMYNAIDFDRFDRAYGSDKTLTRSRFGFADTDILIGNVASIVPWKGQLFLLQAVKMALSIVPQIRLCFVGRDNNGFKNLLEEYARENRIFNHLHFLGERRDIPEILSMLDFFISPSFSEGFGLSVIEAMYMGLPVIATDTEGLSEIIENGRDGILVPPGEIKALADEIVAFAGNKEKTKKIGFSARLKVINCFSPRIYIGNLELLYKRALGQSQNRLRNFQAV